MSLSSVGGPLVVVQGTGDQDFGPSLSPNGFGLMDTRFPYQEGAAGLKALGYSSNSYIPTINAVPSTLSTTAIAAAQAPTSGTPLTLASTTANGITVLAAPVQVLPSRNTVPAGAVAIDGLPGTVFVSQTGAVQLYDPSKVLARAVTIASNANDSAGTFTIQGFDVYGYPMSDAITGASASGSVTGLKAFKFVTGILPSGTINSTLVSAGQSDVYGLPIRSDFWGDLQVYWNSALITATTGFVAAVTTTATPSTGDVRGTYAVQATASNGTRRLQIFSTPSVADLLTQTGLWGVTQA